MTLTIDESSANSGTEVQSASGSASRKGRNRRRGAETKRRAELQPRRVAALRSPFKSRFILKRKGVRDLSTHIRVRCVLARHRRHRVHDGMRDGPRPPRSDRSPSLISLALSPSTYSMPYSLTFLSVRTTAHNTWPHTRGGAITTKCEFVPRTHRAVAVPDHVDVRSELGERQ